MAVLRLRALVVFVACVSACLADWMSDEKKLYKDLLVTREYNPNIRPRTNHNETVVVSFGQSLLEIEKLDVHTQTLTIQGWLKMLWRDDNLAWNPADYGGLREIRLPPAEIWIPDITLYNSRSLSMWDSTMHVLSLVYADGTVTWIPPVRMAVGCSLDLSQFPWDKHHCHLRFGSWTYDSTKVNLTMSGTENTTLEMDNYKEHQEWELGTYAVNRTETVYACCPGQGYVDIMFNLSLTRRESHLVHLLVAPSVALMFLMPAMFLLPPDSGEKMQLGVGILVSQTLLLVTIENFVPAGHPTVPVLVQYFLTNLVLTAISLFLSTIVVGAWSKSNRNSMVPRILRTVFLGVLGRALCVQRETFMPEDGQQQHPGGVNMRRLDLEGSGDPGPGVDDDKHHMMATYARLVTVSEWRQLAAVIDRLLYLVFLFLAFCVLVAMR